MVVGMAGEVGGMTEGAIAGTVSGCAPSVSTGNLDAGDRRMTQGAVTIGAIAMHRANDITGMTADAEGNAGDSIMILNRMVGEIVCVWGVTIRTIGSDKCRNGADDYWPCAAVAGGAGVLTAGRNIMQVNYFGGGGEWSVAGVAAVATEGEEVAVGLPMADRMTREAGDCHWWWRCGEALTLFDDILDILADGVAVAGYAITEVDGIDVTHGGGDMAGRTACGGGDHVMLD